MRRGRSAGLGGVGRTNDVFYGFEFPFEEKAMTYVDLSRDVIVTSHRYLGSGRNPVKFTSSSEDLWLARMPVRETCFKLAIFRMCIDRSVFERIHTFVATFRFGLHELFPGRYWMVRAISKSVVVIVDPFLKSEGDLEGGDGDIKSYGMNCGRDFINKLKLDLSEADVYRGGKSRGRIKGLFHWGMIEKAFETGNYLLEFEKDEKLIDT